jgi:predicted ABC-type ATPase
VSSPILTVIAGANGCGKSTLTKWARAFFQQDPTLDPDAMAVDLQAQTSSEVSPIEAGKRVLNTAETYLEKGVSFSVETTLSGSTYLKMLVEAKKLGYRTCLFYIGTENLDINISRVKLRVVAGGTRRARRGPNATLQTELQEPSPRAGYRRRGSAAG